MNRGRVSPASSARPSPQGGEQGPLSPPLQIYPPFPAGNFSPHLGSAFFDQGGWVLIVDLILRTPSCA